MTKSRISSLHHLVFIGGVLIFGFIFLVLPWFSGDLVYSNGEIVADVSSTSPTSLTPPPPPLHIKTPTPVRAIYMSSWVAATPSIRAKLMALIDETEVNAVVIDVKDYTGHLSFLPRNETLLAYGSGESRIRDIDEFIRELHGKGVYVIARVAVFQDNYLARKRLDLAVKFASTGALWTDNKKIAWVDMKSKEVWDYNFLIAKEAADRGFDEINFDYIRFPSDGKISDASYPFYRKGEQSKQDAIKEFYEYLGSRKGELGVPISGDLFGMVLTETNDLNIGQILENGLASFDYVAPMIYPSHYGNGFNGWKNPATMPYELVSYVMASGTERAIAASSSPQKLRPWLQDFDMGATYDAAMVRKQKQALYDLGLDSWMMWDPANTYTRGALD